MVQIVMVLQGCAVMTCVQLIGKATTAKVRIIEKNTENKRNYVLNIKMKQKYTV